MNIFIIGITGRIGGLLARKPRSRGDVHGLVRSQDQRTELEKRGMRARVGELSSTSSDELAATFGEVDAIVFSAGSNGGSTEVTNAIDGGGVGKPIEAARIGGVERFALVSVLPESSRERDLGEEVEYSFAEEGGRRRAQSQRAELPDPSSIATSRRSRSGHRIPRSLGVSRPDYSRGRCWHSSNFFTSLGSVGRSSKSTRVRHRLGRRSERTLDRHSFGASGGHAGLPRDVVFGVGKARMSIEESLRRLRMDYLDVCLIHWPNPSVGRYVEAWRALVDARDRGLVCSIGVSNFTGQHLRDVIDDSGLTPALNQIELHPYFPQAVMRQINADLGIRTESWSPLGKSSAPFEERPVVEAATAHDATPAQVVLRWQLQLGALPVPKSADPRRQRENLDVFGFELTEAEVEAISGLADENGRLFGGDPDVHEEM